MQRALLVAGLLLIGCGSPTGRSIEADGAIAIDSRIVVANDSAVADFVLTDGDPEDDALLGDAAPADAAAADARSADATLVRDARSDAAAASCQVNHGGCSDNADCLPGSNGGVQCVCISGYAGDGWSCKASQSVQVLEVAAGGYHSCARFSDGRIRCWGQNDRGQLGPKIGGAERTLPTRVRSFEGKKAVQLALGWRHSCARFADGSLSCWGNSAAYPRDIAAAGALDVSAGGTNSCYVTAQAGVRCWGRQHNGDGTNYIQISPVDVVDIAGLVAQQVSVGWDHTCARFAGGALRCWGDNTDGELGDGTRTHRARPVKLVGLPSSPAVEIATGGRFSCGRFADGSIYCWGVNNRAQVGDGTLTTRILTPSRVTGLVGLKATQLSATSMAYHACAIFSDQSLRCWGFNEQGQLGDGTLTLRSAATPVVLPSGVSPSQISVGGWHSCAQFSDQQIRCWGFNKFGELGDGTTTRRLTPQRVSQTW